MHKSMSIAAAIIATPLLLAATANANFSGADGEATLTCQGGGARVEGASNRLKITGACKSLTVEGADNEIYIDLAKGATIVIAGADNQVFWTGPKGMIPRMRVNGADNRIARAR